MTSDEDIVRDAVEYAREYEPGTAWDAFDRILTERYALRAENERLRGVITKAIEQLRET